jgi:DNA-binding transcriptional LysR family regulator
MEVTWLEDFIVLADCMNFSRAAEQRNITQPAFSRRIRVLEAWVGHSLFDRGTHRLSLTPAGETFLGVAEEVLARLSRGREEARAAARATSSSLRFASTHALSLTFFPAWLRTMDATFALNTVELIADNMQACERIMLEGQAQFLLCHDHPAASNRLEPLDFLSVHLGHDVLMPVTARDEGGRPRYLLPGAPDAPVPHLTFSDKSGIGRIIAAAWTLEGREVWLKPIFTSHLAIVLKTLARDGRGVAWSPRSLIEDELEPGGPLARAGDESWDIPIEIRLFRPRARQNENAEAFWSALVARANA